MKNVITAIYAITEIIETIFRSGKNLCENIISIFLKRYYIVNNNHKFKCKYLKCSPLTI